MLLGKEYIRQSLELHLFFARIMKEHSFFLQAAFTPRDKSFAQKADNFRRQFDKLLNDAVSLSNGVVSTAVLQSGEVYTQYTVQAEMVTSFLTGVKIPSEITKAEIGLQGGGAMPVDSVFEQRVFAINQTAINLLNELIRLKELILENVLSCQMFTFNYPLLIDHILREAKLYLDLVQRLQCREIIYTEQNALDQELFWNRIMAEHAKFIRGLLDPTEEQLIFTANNFGNQFDQLVAEAQAAMDMTIPREKVTADSLDATTAIRDFKAQGTQGLIECQIRSIIIPLLGDHTLREANHFLRLLQIFK